MSDTGDRPPIPLPRYSESLEQAGEYLRSILPLLFQHRVVPNPINFAVWFEYASGRSQSLSKQLDRLIADGGEYTNELGEALYAEHIRRCDDTTAERVEMDLRRVVGETLSTIEEQSSRASQSTETLEGYSASLNGASGIDQIRKTVSEILQETRSVTQVNRDVVEHLEAATREVEQLRRQLDQVKKEATTDILTGVLNRRAFDHALDEHVARYSEGGMGFSVILLDIDRFKEINDKYGHLIGDKVLRMVAQLLKRNLKGQDIVARYGGDEFALVLPNTNPGAARTVADNLRRTAERSRLKRTDTGEPLDVVTLSIGVAGYQLGESITDLLQRVDDALYQSKRAGRNHVSVAG